MTTIPDPGADAYRQYLEDGVTDYSLVVKKEAELARVSMRKSAGKRARSKYEPLVPLRVFGNGLLVLGHFIMLKVSLPWGVLIKLCAVGLTLPYFVKYKFWDVIFLSSLFTIIELYSLI